MKTYTWNYSRDGELTFAPLFHTETSSTYDEAENAALKALGHKATLHGFSVRGTIDNASDEPMRSPRDRSTAD